MGNISNNNSVLAFEAYVGPTVSTIGHIAYVWRTVGDSSRCLAVALMGSMHLAPRATDVDHAGHSPKTKYVADFARERRQTKNCVHRTEITICVGAP